MSTQIVLHSSHSQTQQLNSSDAGLRGKLPNEINLFEEVLGQAANKGIKKQLEAAIKDIPVEKAEEALSKCRQLVMQVCLLAFHSSALALFCTGSECAGFVENCAKVGLFVFPGACKSHNPSVLCCDLMCRRRAHNAYCCSCMSPVHVPSKWTRLTWTSA